MDLDLLKKLVRLATNNPNEHEANSAAMRVCKMLLDADFKFVAEVPKPISSPYKQQEEWMRRQQEEYARTAQEYSRIRWQNQGQGAYNQQQAPKKCGQCGLYDKMMDLGIWWVCGNCYATTNK